MKKTPDFYDLSSLLVHHRWPWHIGFWLLYAVSRAMPYYLTVAYFETSLLRFMLWMELPFVLTVYLTIWLYEFFCYRGKYKTYLLVGVGIWALYVVLFAKAILYFIGHMPHLAESTWDGIFINQITKYFFTFVVITMMKYFKDNFIQQYHENQRKQLQMATELENLKSQIAPHFLFNTMNNFYGLAVARSEKLPGLMVRLSELLRYALYETKQDTVPLAKDVANLQGYIELEKIRLEDSLEFEFSSNIPADCSAEIAPLLLVVFLENAFKHAKKVQIDVTRIKVRLHLDTDGVLSFFVMNNCLPLASRPTGEQHGLGLENVRKRLEVLYPNGAHQLNITQTESDFSVKLTIKL